MPHPLANLSPKKQFTEIKKKQIWFLQSAKYINQIQVRIIKNKVDLLKTIEW